MQIPWPYTNAPGDEAQEGAGKLTNVFVERRGDEENIIWRRAPGCRVFVVDPSVATIVGDAAVTAISSVVNSMATLVGSSTVSGAALAGINRNTSATLTGSATVSGATSVIISVGGDIQGDATVEAVGQEG